MRSIKAKVPHAQTTMLTTLRLMSLMKGPKMRVTLKEKKNRRVLRKRKAPRK